MAKIDRSAVERTLWAQGALRVALLETEAFSVTEQNMPPGTVETRHLHRRASQYMLVLSGTAQLEVEGDTALLATDDAYLVDAGRAHHVETHGDAPLRLLVVSQPSARDDRVEL